MQENEKEPDEKLLILPLGEESKKITQVISNDTARQIIELLADAPLSASDIAERLQAPLTTITYNLENLESVGLVKVERIKYSEKGREVKIYAPVRKLIVVVPEKTDKKSVADVIRKYLGVILAAVLASSAIEFLARSAKVAQLKGESFESLPVPSPVAAPTPVSLINETMKGGEIAGTVPTTVATPMVPQVPVVPAPTAAYANITASPPAPASLPESAVSEAASPEILTKLADYAAAHPGIVFLLGCLFVIALLIAAEYRRRSERQQ